MDSCYNYLARMSAFIDSSDTEEPSTTPSVDPPEEKKKSIKVQFTENYVVSNSNNVITKQINDIDNNNINNNINFYTQHDVQLWHSFTETHKLVGDMSEISTSHPKSSKFCAISTHTPLPTTPFTSLTSAQLQTTTSQNQNLNPHQNQHAIVALRQTTPVDLSPISSVIPSVYSPKSIFGFHDQSLNSCLSSPTVSSSVTPNSNTIDHVTTAVRSEATLSNTRLSSNSVDANVNVNVNANVNVGIATKAYACVSNRFVKDNCKQAELALESESMRIFETETVSDSDSDEDNSSEYIDRNRESDDELRIEKLNRSEGEIFLAMKESHKKSKIAKTILSSKNRKLHDVVKDLKYLTHTPLSKIKLKIKNKDNNKINIDNYNINKTANGRKKSDNQNQNKNNKNKPKNNKTKNKNKKQRRGKKKNSIKNKQVTFCDTVLVAESDNILAVEVGGNCETGSCQVHWFDDRLDNTCKILIKPSNENGLKICNLKLGSSCEDIKYVDTVLNNPNHLFQTRFHAKLFNKILVNNILQYLTLFDLSNKMGLLNKHWNQFLQSKPIYSRLLSDLFYYQFKNLSLLAGCNNIFQNLSSLGASTTTYTTTTTACLDDNKNNCTCSNNSSKNNSLKQLIQEWSEFDACNFLFESTKCDKNNFGYTVLPQIASQLAYFMSRNYECVVNGMYLFASTGVIQKFLLFSKENLQEFRHILSADQIYVIYSFYLFFCGVVCFVLFCFVMFVVVSQKCWLCFLKIIFWFRTELVLCFLCAFLNFCLRSAVIAVLCVNQTKHNVVFLIANDALFALYIRQRCLSGFERKLWFSSDFVCFKPCSRQFSNVSCCIFSHASFVS